MVSFKHLLVIFLLTFATGCANSPVGKNLEQSLAADSRLQENPAIFANNQTPQPQPKPTIGLPTDFPTEIPQYPNATLQEVTPATDNGSVSTRWSSLDPSNFISTFYLKEFQTNNWEILQRPVDDNGGTLQARRNDLLLKISIQPKSVTGNANTALNQPQTSTELLIEYTRNAPAIAQATPQSTTESTPQPNDPTFIGPVLPSNLTQQPTSNPTPNTTPSNSEDYSDFNKTPQQLQQYIKDLIALGVLPVESSVKSDNTNQFEPSKIITRREYARWLVAANNAIYANNPAKQIRLASETQSAFSDVSKTNPDFPVIQGLAEAGLIPSSLSGDSTEVLFRPDAPLTREQLILWKLPLDTRQALPTASLDAVRQTWGFQDVGKIDSKALRAVLADFQNGEQSNIRRVFGYTTLFQPKKSVTRAEAAAALWYFGTQGDGVSAADALKLKR